MRVPRRRPDRGRWVRATLASVAPLGFLVWYALLDAEGRAKVVARLPPGAGERIGHAFAALGILAALAWIALPILHGAEAGLRRGVAWHRSRRGAARVLFFPGELLATGLHALALAGFYGGAVLVVAACLFVLLCAVWMFAPEFLGGFADFADRARSLGDRF